MHRSIVGFHQDDVGDWIADLSCLHSQHVRHQPPFRERPWVEDGAGRDEHVGTELECPLCDRAELPDGLTLARTAGPFTDATLPDGLRAAHRVAPGRWGVLRVLEGEVTLVFESPPPTAVRLGAGASHPIPPDVAHHVEPAGDVELAVDFLVRRDPVPPEEQGGEPACWIGLVEDHRDHPIEG